MTIDAADFIHPEDEKALENLRSIPLLGTALKMFLKIVSEEFLHGLNMAQKIRLGEDQLPRLYQLLPPICETLGIAVPELYLEMDPMPNAYTFGDTRLFVTITSGLVDSLEERELRAVLAHECGHIVCRHVLYHTLAAYLLKFGAGFLGVGEALTMPLQLALFYWSRRSELSADRAAALATGDPDSVVQTMIRLAGGPKSITAEVNVDRYIAQADAYTQLLDSKWDRVLQGVAVMNQNHPLLAVRTREIRNWCASEHYLRLRTAMQRTPNAYGKCPQCGRPQALGWKFCSYCGAGFDATKSAKSGA
jgi:Zn-dependent protease with chaperone function